MTDIQQLRQTVIDQERIKGQRRIELKEQEVEQKIKDAKVKVDKTLKQHFDAERRRIKDHYDRQIQQTENKIRQSSLSARQSLLDALFDDALNRMNQWDKQEQLAFMKHIIAQFDHRSMRVQLGEYTDQTLNEADLEAVKAEFPQITFIHGEDAIPRQGGFVIVRGQITYNFLFSRMIELSRSDLGAELAAEIFAKVVPQ